jgi:histone H3
VDVVEGAARAMACVLIWSVVCGSSRASRIPLRARLIHSSSAMAAQTKQTAVKSKATKRPLGSKTGKKSAGSSGSAGVKKSFRWRPGTVALRQVKKLQQTTGTLIARAPFSRLVREIAESHKAGLRFQSSAVAAIQEATESFVIGLLGDANLTALHANRVTALPRDLQLVRRLRGERL